MIHGDFIIKEVDGVGHAMVLRYLNAQEPSFPALKDHHLENGHWWVARLTLGRDFVGFAGLVPMTPFDGYWFCKRAYVVPVHRGGGLQRMFLRLREDKAVTLGARALVGECAGDNRPSENNFLKSGFMHTSPEQVWGAPGSIFFIKRLAA
jgi:hypothetical protein